MGSRSPKSNQFLFLSQQYSCTSLVKIQPFILETMQKSHFPTIWALLWPWKLGQGHQNLISSFSCHNNIVVQVWSKSIHSFIIGCRQAIFQQSKPLCDLEMGSRSPKFNQFFSMSQQYRCTSLVKILPFILEIGCRQSIFQQCEPPVTLKMGSKSPKFNQFLSLSQQYSCTSLVKIHIFILEIGCRKAIFQQSEPSCDLKNGVKVTKINQFFFMSQQYCCARLVKIHPFLHEIGCRQAIFQQSKPLCDLENGGKVTKI